MKNKFTSIILLSCFLIMLASCESKAEKEQRQERLRIELALHQEKERIELEKQEKKEAAEREEKRVKQEQERREQAIIDKYIYNSLHTGSTPYAYCFGGNKSCTGYECSEIKVKTPHNSDVMVTIKRNGIVYDHAYIRAGSQFTFELPNGTYQPFFYYGKGWNPNKEMKETACGMLKGGFVANEDFGKDNPQTLSNDILSYTLILQEGGNFSTKPSDADEAF